jgi:hypothetical protein
MIFLHCWMEKLVDPNILVRIVCPCANSQPTRGMMWMRLLRFLACKENALLQLPIWSFLCCAWMSARFLMFDFGGVLYVGWFIFLCWSVLRLTFLLVHLQHCSHALLVERAHAYWKLLLIFLPSSLVTADWVPHCVHAPDQQKRCVH